MQMFSWKKFSFFIVGSLASATFLHAHASASGSTGEVTYYTTDCYPIHTGCVDKITFVENSSDHTINWAETEALELRTLSYTGDAGYYLSGTERKEIQLSGEKLVFVEAYGLFFTDPNSIYRTAFSGARQTNTGAISYDLDHALKGDREISPHIEKYLPVKNAENEVIGYILHTVQDPHEGFNDIYAPRYQTTSFFTTNGTELKLVLSGDATLKFTGTKEVLAEQIGSLTNDEDKNLVQTFLGTGTLTGAQLISLEGEKLVFLDLGTGTLVLLPTPSSLFNTAFTGGIAGIPDYQSNAVQPSSIPLGTVVSYNEVRKNGSILGYTLKNHLNQRFYAPKRPPVTSSGGGGRVVYTAQPTTVFSAQSTGSKSEFSQPEIMLPQEKELIYSGKVTTPNCFIDDSPYSDEQNQAYLRACEQDITTMRTIQAARLDEPLTRAELAKMLSVFLHKTLGIQPMITGTTVYQDVNTELGDLAEYIQLAYQLQIMGINADGTPMENFDPYKTLSRAEFGTAFSREIR